LKGVVSATVTGRRKYGHVHETLLRAVVCALLHAIVVVHTCSGKFTVTIIRVKLPIIGRFRVRKVHLLVVFSLFQK